jgi:potassium/hydrogen antiporter
VPILIGFLGLGMLLGSDGPGGIEFDDAHLARLVGVVCLAAILFEGGLGTDRRDLRPVLAPALALGTVGVIVTGAIAGAAAYALFDLSASGALLLGAVVGSTDAAAVFATLRRTGLDRRLGVLLESESGVNDPMAVALTVGLIAYITDPSYGAADVALLLVRQLGIGLAVGLAAGAAAAWLFRRLPGELSPFAPALALACAAVGFGLAGVVDGSGFLAVYLVGIALHDVPQPTRRQVTAFMQGGAFVAQVVLFVVLGLLVFPHELTGVILPGLGVAAALTLLARPAAVLVSTLGLGFDRRERALLGWAGLRGAVPIVLATFALSKGLTESTTIFNAVFFVVVASVLVQGLTLPWAVRRLGLVDAGPPAQEPPIASEVVEPLGAELLDFVVGAADPVVGRPIRALDLPTDARVSVVIRGADAIPPAGDTRLEAGDRVYVLARTASTAEARQRLDAWRAADGDARE